MNTKKEKEEDDMHTSEYKEDIQEEEIREESPRRDTKAPQEELKRNILKI